jgi:hypothetical protein
MIVITDEPTFTSALASVVDPRLGKLLRTRLKLYRAGCLLDLTMLVVLEPGDTAEDIQRETGLNPLVSPLDGTRYGDTGFEQYCDWLSFSDGHFEWITCAGDTGYATILLVPDRPDVDAELIAMLHEYAGEAGRG